MLSNVFRTGRLPVAMFIHASNRLRFLNVEPVGDARMEFIFDDPERQGPQLEYEFEQVAKLAANIMYASLKFLRSKMTAGQRQIRGGGRHVNHS
jgi:hypothetical protein